MEENNFTNENELNNNIPNEAENNNNAQKENNQPNKTVNYNTNYNTNYYRKDSKKTGCLVAVIAVVVIVAALIIGFFSMIGSMFSSAVSSVSSTTGSTYTYVEGDYVETIPIEGAISSSPSYYSGGYNHQWILEEIDRLKNDESNKGIILYINTPGGGTYESDEVYNALKDYKEATGNPVYSYYAQTAASGGVYLSMASDEIYANRMTLTGSIGVIMSYYDASGLMEKLGIKEDNVASGRNKAMGGYSGLTEEQRGILQSIVDETYNIFVDIVAEGRNMPREKVLELADGRVYSAKQALDLGLIDYVMDYDDFMIAMENKEEFAGCEFIENTYVSNSFIDTLFAKAGIGSRKSEDAQLLEMIERANQNPVQYLFDGVY